MKYYSFDIFDTCLVRLCGEPHNLIDVLSKELFNTDNELQRQLFVANRIKADDGSCDGLEGIYKRVSSCCSLPLPVKDMAEREMQLERKMLVAVTATKQLVDKLRAKGRIMFVSDMYLPSEFLREVLKEQGFYQNGDLLYVSDEHNAWKRDGSLFRLIHEKESVPYRKWHHYGDNKHSDCRIPLRLGIRTHHLCFPYLRYEKRWMSHITLQFQYASILAGVSRAIRLQSSFTDQNAFVCNISAPLMTSWVLKIMNDAVSRNINRLYFCARDAHAEFIIARQLSPLFPNLSVHYLFISRDSLNGDAALCMDYFKQIGLASHEAVAIVDTNTTGNTLDRINNMLCSSGYKAVEGYFWSFVPRGEEYLPLTENNSISYYNVNCFYLNATAKHGAGWMTGMSAIYEMLFSLNYHKKTASYYHHCGVVRPKLEPDAEDRWTLLPNVVEAKKNNDFLLKQFAQAFVNTHLDKYCNDVFASLALQTLVDFIEHPSKVYLRYMNRFVWKGKPFVDKIWRKHIWKRGSRVYSIPTWISEIAYLMIKNV